MAETSKPDKAKQTVYYSNFQKHTWRHILILLVVILLIAIGVLFGKHELSKKATTVAPKTINGVPVNQINTDSHIGKYQYTITNQKK